MEKQQLILPKKIEVGYQKRKDTYEDKLGFITFRNDEGLLRKEATWTRWRDKTIEPDVFDNVPTEGFVLNKNVGGQGGWHSRQAKIRIYDPRGFEIEITVENLLYILMYNSCIQGKGLEGQYVYAWDNQALVLVPCKSPDYAKIIEYNKFLEAGLKITAKDLVIGTTYLDKFQKRFTYLGHHQTYLNVKRHEIDKKTGKVSVKTKKQGKKHVFYCHDDSWNKIKMTNSFATLKGIEGQETPENLEKYYEVLAMDNEIYPYKDTELLSVKDNFDKYISFILDNLNSCRETTYNILLVDKDRKPLYTLVFDKRFNYGRQRMAKLELKLYDEEVYSYKNQIMYKQNVQEPVVKHTLFDVVADQYASNNYSVPINLDSFKEVTKELDLETILKDAYYIEYERDLTGIPFGIEKRFSTIAFYV